MAEEFSYSGIFQTREQILASLRRRRVFDLAVIGGGVHGVCFARLAALSGLAVILLEKDDYGVNSSCGARLISSALGAGPGRPEYLAQRRVAMLGRALHAVAPHLLTRTSLRSSFSSATLGSRLLFSVSSGLSSPASCWHRRETQEILFEDYLINDHRFVIENLVAARQEGALCLNHACLDSVRARSDGAHYLRFRDLSAGLSFEIISGLVVNCTGRDVASTGYPKRQNFASNLLEKKQSLMLFSRPWQDAAAFISSDYGPGFWVSAHPVGCLVVEEACELKGAEPAGLPLEQRVSRALFDGQSGLDPLERWDESWVEPREGGSWLYAGRLINLLGGTFAEAFHTVEQGFRALMRYASVDIQYQSLWGRRMPGALDVDWAELRRRASELSLPEERMQELVSRYGWKTQYMLEGSDAAAPATAGCLQGEERYLRLVEQAETETDLARRAGRFPSRYSAVA